MQIGKGVSMKMNFNLSLAQTQKLVMTPELKQAIEILQFNSLELNEFIVEELLNNPILQKNETEMESTNSVQIEEASETFEKKDDLYEKIDWKEVANDYSFSGGGKVNYSADDDVNYDNFVADEESLIDHLLLQLQFTVLSTDDREVAKYIIENINPNGYLEINVEHATQKLNITEGELEYVIKTIQTFEPLGVGARTLKECLAIQAEIKYDEDPLIVDIINDYLNDLASNRLNVISKALDISSDLVQNYADMIKTLEPKPGRSYSSLREIRYVTPDVVVTKVDGEYVINVNESTAPKLKINKFYKALLNDDINDQASEYISKKLSSALKIIKSIEQRRNTIYKVVESIIDYQFEFFEKGNMYLKTLTLKDIAEDIGVHESTVSRAVNGKYMQCPSGLYEIKFFFQSGVSSAFGEGVSSESIKVVIRDLIDNEDSKKPISDQNISNELNALGIKVSRRTIAKYRDEMFIPASSKRKRY